MNINEATLFPNLDGLAREIQNRSIAKNLIMHDRKPKGETLNRYVRQTVITTYVKVENKAGTLFQVLNIFKEEKLNIEASYWTPRDSENHDHWIFALSRTNDKDPINTTEYKKRLEGKICNLNPGPEDKRFNAEVFLQ